MWDGWASMLPVVWAGAPVCLEDPKRWLSVGQRSAPRGYLSFRMAWPLGSKKQHFKRART